MKRDVQIGSKWLVPRRHNGIGTGGLTFDHHQFVEVLEKTSDEGYNVSYVTLEEKTKPYRRTGWVLAMRVDNPDNGWIPYKEQKNILKSW